MYTYSFTKWASILGIELITLHEKYQISDTTFFNSKFELILLLSFYLPGALIL